MGIPDLLPTLLSIVPPDLQAGIYIQTHRAQSASDAQEEEPPEPASEDPVPRPVFPSGLRPRAPLAPSAGEDFYDQNRLSCLDQVQALIVDGNALLRQPFTPIRWRSDVERGLLPLTHPSIAWGGDPRPLEILYEDVAEGFFNLIVALFEARPHLEFLSFHFERINVPVCKRVEWQSRDIARINASRVFGAGGRHAIDTTAVISNTSQERAFVGESVFGRGDFIGLLTDRFKREILMRHVISHLAPLLKQWLKDTVPQSEALKKRRICVCFDGEVDPESRLNSFIAERRPLLVNENRLQGTAVKEEPLDADDALFISNVGFQPWHTVPAGEADASMIATLHKLCQVDMRQRVAGSLPFTEFEVVTNDSDTLAQLLLFCKQRSRMAVRDSDDFSTDLEDSEKPKRERIRQISDASTARPPSVWMRFLQITKPTPSPVIDVRALLHALESRAPSTDNSDHGLKPGIVESIVALLTLNGSDYVPGPLPGTGALLNSTFLTKMATEGSLCAIDYRRGIVYLDEEELSSICVGVGYDAVMHNDTFVDDLELPDYDEQVALSAVPESGGTRQPRWKTDDGGFVHVYRKTDPLAFLRQAWIKLRTSMRDFMLRGIPLAMWQMEMKSVFKRVKPPGSRGYPETFLPLRAPLTPSEMVLLSAVHLHTKYTPTSGIRRLTDVFGTANMAKILTKVTRSYNTAMRESLEEQDVAQLLQSGLVERVLEAYADTQNGIQMREKMYQYMVQRAMDQDSETDVGYAPDADNLLSSAIDQLVMDGTYEESQLIGTFVQGSPITFYTRQTRLREVYRFFRSQSTSRGMFWMPIYEWKEEKDEESGQVYDYLAVVSSSVHVVYAAVLWQMVYYLVGWTQQFNASYAYLERSAEVGWAWTSNGYNWNVHSTPTPVQTRTNYAAKDVVRLSVAKMEMVGTTQDVGIQGDELAERRILYDVSGDQNTSLASIKKRVARVIDVDIPVCAGWMVNASLYDNHQPMYSASERVLFPVTNEAAFVMESAANSIASRHCEVYPVSMERYLNEVTNARFALFRTVKSGLDPAGRNAWGDMVLRGIASVASGRVAEDVPVELYNAIYGSLAAAYQISPESTQARLLSYQVQSRAVRPVESEQRSLSSAKMESALATLGRVDSSCCAELFCAYMRDLMKQERVVLDHTSWQQSGEPMPQSHGFFAAFPFEEDPFLDENVSRVVMQGCSSLVEMATAQSYMSVQLQNVLEDSVQGGRPVKMKYNYIDGVHYVTCPTAPDVGYAFQTLLIDGDTDALKPGTVDAHTRVGCRDASDMIIPREILLAVYPRAWTRLQQRWFRATNEDFVVNPFMKEMNEMLDIDTEQSALPVSVIDPKVDNAEYQVLVHTNPHLLPMSDDMRLYIAAVTGDLSVFMLGKIEDLWLRMVVHSHRYKLAMHTLPVLVPGCMNSEALAGLFASTWEASEFTRGVFWDTALLYGTLQIDDDDLRLLSMELCCAMPWCKERVAGGRQSTHNGYKADATLMKAVNGDRVPHTLYWTSHPLASHPEKDGPPNMDTLPGLYDDVYKNTTRVSDILSYSRNVRTDLAEPFNGRDLSSVPVLPGVRYLMGDPLDGRKESGPDSLLVAVEFDTSHKEWDPMSATFFLTTVGILDPSRPLGQITRYRQTMARRVYELLRDPGVVNDIRGARTMPKETHYASLYWGARRVGVSSEVLGEVSLEDVSLDVRRTVR